VAGGGHRLESAALVLQIALGGLDQVGDQVEPALQLHVDLGEGVLVGVARGDQAVVDAHGPNCEHHHNCEQDQQTNHQSSPCSCNPPSRRYDQPALQHTQGTGPMKDRTRRQRLIRRGALIGALLPMALASSAQTPLRWNVKPSAPAPAASTAPATLPTRPASMPAYLPPVEEVMPPSSDFNVRQFEAIAQELVANQRVPGMAMAIVQGGKVLSARGYGITDVSNAEPVDEHTVFRLASLSKAFAGTVTGLLVNEGALRWDSHVADYMPSLQFSRPGRSEELTVAEVLSQRVGLTHKAYDQIGR